MYKYSNTEHTAVTNLETGTSGIHPGVWMWEQYQEWVAAGGVTEAFDTRTSQEILDEAIQKKSSEIISYGDTQDIKPFEYPELSGVFYKVTDAIINTIKYCEVLNLVDSDPIPVNGGNWDNVDGTVSTPMTIGVLKDLYKTGYEIPSHNYGVAKSHIGAVSSLTSVEDVEGYDHTTGWK